MVKFANVILYDDNSNATNAFKGKCGTYETINS